MMKKIFLTLFFAAAFALAGSAQKFALIDMEYILKNVPQYEMAKEQEATELRYKYFGPEGELYKKRQTLMKPIQDDIYNAVKKLSEERGYQAIFDRASSANIIYASPRIDVSNEVLEKLGYKLCRSELKLYGN